MDRRVVGWSEGRRVDDPCGGQTSPWPARKVTDSWPKFKILKTTPTPKKRFIRHKRWGSFAIKVEVCMP